MTGSGASGWLLAKGREGKQKIAITANDIMDVAKIVTCFTFIIRIEQTRYSFSLLKVVYDLLKNFPIILIFIQKTVRFSWNLHLVTSK